MTGPVDRETQGDVEAIQRVREAHVAALDAGDADRWASLFTDDGVQMPPNASVNVGGERIRAWSRAFLAAFQSTFALTVEEVQLAGDWAFERGGYRITLTPKTGGDLIQDVGKYITIYHRQPGGPWRIARDIWNTDLPPPGLRS